MISFDSSQIAIWISYYFWPFVRILALIASAPVFNEKQVPSRIKIGLALVTTYLIAPFIPLNETPVFSIEAIWLLLQQIMIGIMMGLMIQLAFVAIRVAGEIIGLQMGLSFATFFDPSGGPNMPVLARFLNVLAILLFLTFHGHLWLFSMLVDSFTILPIAEGQLSRMGILVLLQAATTMFIYGLMFALPLVAILLLLNISMGILNRMTPQLSVFVVGFPLSLFMGIYMLGNLLPYVNRFFESLFGEFFLHLQAMLDALIYV